MGQFVQKFTFNDFQENTYVVFDDLKNCVIIDPGCYARREQEELMYFIDEHDLTTRAVLLTHAHIDHVLGLAFVMQQYAIECYIHSADLQTLSAVSNYAHIYGFPGYVEAPVPAKIMKHQDHLEFGNIQLKVLYTPGHSPGHVVFYAGKEQFVINGDVLFRGSFGRVDLPGGDIEVLKKSIFDVMFKLPGETVVYCGHGPETTIGNEQRTNYILNF